MTLFTVFTATYNRARTLPRVFDSLRAQTLEDFEWLIIDDGSTDETPRLVARWEREARFPVRYFRQENQGKHLAHNAALERAAGELFLPLDSDDACVPRALERLRHHWETIPPARRGGFTGVSVLCMDPQGRVVGEPFPDGVRDTDWLELRYRHKVAGEKWSFDRTEVLRRHPFPEIRGTRFVPESLVSEAVARRYKTRVANEALRVYHRDDSPGSDSLVRSGPELCAAGKLAYNEAVLTRDLDWFGRAPLRFVRCAAQYARFSLHSGRPLRGQLKKLPALGRALFLAGLPAGAALYARDLARRRL